MPPNCVCALAAIAAHVKKSFAESLNVNVFSFLNILSSASVRTNSTVAAEFRVSRRANSGSSPAQWAQLQARREPFNSWPRQGSSSSPARPDHIGVGPNLQSNWTGVERQASKADHSDLKVGRQSAGLSCCSNIRSEAPSSNCEKPRLASSVSLSVCPHVTSQLPLDGFS